MDDRNAKNAGKSGPPEGTGYSTPGSDRLEQSPSPDIPSPSMTGEQRLQTPKGRIESIGETPADANPALDETIGFEQGTASTADLLAAREFAEEEAPRAKGNIHPYEDEALATAGEFEVKDSGRPNWPDDRQESPVEYMDAPRANAPLLSGNVEGLVEPNIAARQDSAIDRASTQASKQESRSGLAPVGMDAEEDIYERREMETPTEQSEMDRIAPGMSNVPPEDKNG